MEVKKAIQLVHSLVEQNRALINVKGALRLLDNSEGTINSLVKRKEALEKDVVSKQAQLTKVDDDFAKKVSDREAEVKVIMEDMKKQIAGAETRLRKLNSDYTANGEKQKQGLVSIRAEMLETRNREVAILDKQIATKAKSLSELTGQLEAIKGRL